MASYSSLVLLHIFLLVFWLGTDVGVFLAAKMSERAELSPETRGSLMTLGMVLDRLPRTAVILILPSGFSLADRIGLVALPSTVLLLMWVAAFAWAAIMWAGFLKPQSPVEALSHKVNFYVHVLLVVLLAYAIYALVANDAPLYIILKVGCVAGILVCGIMLDITFKPAVVAFTQIVTQGATDELNAQYSTALAPVYRWVLGIYAFVILATYFGVAKPI